VLGALARGFEVTLVTDGHSTYGWRWSFGAPEGDAVNAEFKGRVKLTKRPRTSISHERAVETIAVQR